MTHAKYVARRTSVMSKVKIVMTFWQIIAAFPWVLGIEFPEAFQTTMDYISIGSWFACGNHGNGGVLAQASGSCWRDCFVEPRGRWSNLVCTHRADIRAIFQRDVRRKVRHNPGARQRVCAVSKI